MSAIDFGDLGCFISKSTWIRFFLRLRQIFFSTTHPNSSISDTEVNDIELSRAVQNKFAEGQHAYYIC
jgi:hypothetical protein